MRQRLVIGTLLILIVSCSSRVDENKLVDEGGVKFQPNADTPYNGKVFGLYEDGRGKLEGTYKDGIMHGKWTHWFQNGQKKKEGSYDMGQKVGKWTYWNEDWSIREIQQYGHQ